MLPDLQNVEANAAVGVNIGMENLSVELATWGLEGIVSREVDTEKEDAARIRRVGGTNNGRTPVEHVTLVNRASRNVGRWVLEEIGVFSSDALKSRHYRSNRLFTGSLRLKCLREFQVLHYRTSIANALAPWRSLVSAVFNFAVKIFSIYHLHA